MQSDNCEGIIMTNSSTPAQEKGSKSSSDTGTHQSPPAATRGTSPPRSAMGARDTLPPISSVCTGVAKPYNY